MPALEHSPLHDRHVALGAKLADFGGWEMPIEYVGGGVVAEHTAVREAVGVFDVSHLGKARLVGPGAAAYTNSCLSADLGKIGPGKAQYTLCCDDATGGVVDDLIAYLYADDDVFLVPNAANTAEVVRRLATMAPEVVRVSDLHHEYGVLAVQGPRSADVLDALGFASDHEYMSFTVSEWRGHEIVVCRTGYTGEHGYELVVPVEGVGGLWDALLEAAAPLGGRPCGLGARDTLRTEMGYPLHGHELSMEISPLQARSSWAVGWKKPQFWGRTPLLAERAAGPRRTMWGLRADDRGIPRPDMTVLVGGKPAGVVTSGTFSPTLKCGIALALIDSEVEPADGGAASVDVRGRMVSMRIVKPPFVPNHTA